MRDLITTHTPHTHTHTHTHTYTHTHTHAHTHTHTHTQAMRAQFDSESHDSHMTASNVTVSHTLTTAAYRGV